MKEKAMIYFSMEYYMQPMAADRRKECQIWIRVKFGIFVL